MMYSILQTVKKYVGIAEDDDSFDVDILASTNAVLATLNQIGVGSAKSFLLYDGSETWDMITKSEAILGLLPAYVGLKVRLMFDPPQSGPLMDNIRKQIDELEWRISIQREEENRSTKSDGMTTFE